MMSNDQIDYLKWCVDRIEGDLERANHRLNRNSKALEITRAILQPLPNAGDAITLLNQSHKEMQDDITRINKDLLDAKAAYKAAFAARRSEP